MTQLSLLNEKIKSLGLSPSEASFCGCLVGLFGVLLVWLVCSVAVAVVVILFGTPMRN
jgi:hypothetical protein